MASRPAALVKHLLFSSCLFDGSVCLIVAAVGRSPTDELAVDEVPLEDVHVEDVQIKRVRLNAVELTVAANFRLPLIEVALRARLAIELLNVVRARVEQIAAVCLLITSREASKDQYVLVGDLVKTAALQADPVRVLLDA